MSRDDASERGDEPNRGLPGGLDRPIDVGLEGRHLDPVLRRAVLTIFALIVLAALAGVFGQRADRSTAASSGASLTLEAPDRLRSGLIFTARIDIEAGPLEITDPRLRLNPGWLDGFTANTLHPEPLRQGSVNGELEFVYPLIEAGDVLTIWTQWQVNPTTNGRFDGGTELLDGDRTLIELDRTVTVFP